MDVFCGGFIPITETERSPRWQKVVIGAALTIFPLQMSYTLQTEIQLYKRMDL